MRVKIGIVIAAAALLMFAPQSAGASMAEGKGLIKGTVTSPTGDVLDQVKVIAFNLDTGDAQETKTDTKGNYEFVGLAKGDYELTAIAEGYDIFGSEEIKVDEKLPVTFDIQLAELFPRPDPAVEQQ